MRWASGAQDRVLFLTVALTGLRMLALRWRDVDADAARRLSAAFGANASDQKDIEVASGMESS